MLIAGSVRGESVRLLTIARLRSKAIPGAPTLVKVQFAPARRRADWQQAQVYSAKCAAITSGVLQVLH